MDLTINFTHREHQYLQTYLNEMYQSSTLRDGPSGPLIIGLRSKFLLNGVVTITDTERRFLLFTLQDTLQSSHSINIPSQLPSSMRLLGDSESKVKSIVNQDSEMSGTYQNEWDIMQSCLTKLGQVPPPPYQPLEVGPDGDENGIATPMHRDPNDGTGYNHR